MGCTIERLLRHCCIGTPPAERIGIEVVSLTNRRFVKPVVKGSKEDASIAETISKVPIRPTCVLHR